MLDTEAIRAALRDRRSGFAVTPILEGGQIGNASIDVRLGPDLIVIRRETGVVAFDPAQADFPERLSEYQHYVRRPMGTPFYLHPREFAIARTLEWVTLPRNLSAQATGRSSWGRLGLVIATATLIQPGFKGTITLELSNLGTVPIVLNVGERIAQLSFFPVVSVFEYKNGALEDTSERESGQRRPTSAKRSRPAHDRRD